MSLMVLGTVIIPATHVAFAAETELNVKEVAVNTINDENSIN